MFIKAIYNLMKYFNILSWWQWWKQRKNDEEIHLRNMEECAAQFLYMELKKYPKRTVVIPKGFMKAMDDKKFTGRRTEMFKSIFGKVSYMAASIEVGMEDQGCYCENVILGWNHDYDVTFLKRC